MTNDQFKKGMVILSEAFPNYEMSPTLFFECLRELNDQDFASAILDIVKTVPQIYPGSNLIAMIRERSIQFAQRRVSNSGKITHEELGDTRTEDWKKLVEKVCKERQAKY